MFTNQGFLKQISSHLQMLANSIYFGHPIVERICFFPEIFDFSAMQSRLRVDIETCRTMGMFLILFVKNPIGSGTAENKPSKVFDNGLTPNNRSQLLASIARLQIKPIIGFICILANLVQRIFARFCFHIFCLHLYHSAI